MSELPKAYEPKLREQKWYTFWQELGVFTADPTSSKPPYCIVIPPPNVTGVLHMGHALVNTLQDILCRWKRMSGYEVLWQPGTDHAGIATQTVVERALLKSEGKRRTDYSKEEFLKHVWAQKEKSETTIISQLKRLGCSLDWTRLRFTLDDGCSKAVKTMFKKLFDAGLIYRGNRLVNWDTVTKTALADDEVEYEEKSGYLYYFSYPLADGSGTLSFATTRPETMLGDVAVAVAPKDVRYINVIGKELIQPITGRKIAIVCDDHVDPAFGTGCVKITPAHDFNDYELALRHKLEMINIMTEDGKINNLGAPFTGLTMAEARDAIIAKMKELGHLVKIEPYTLRVGVSYRSKAVIEPHLSKQWFINMSHFKKDLKRAVAEKEIKLLPIHWESSYNHWIDNLRDWCISRQLWWGHQIPIWYNTHNPEQVICFDGDGLPPEVATNPSEWHQDNDVLDTWFSSALWPFATLGWPGNSSALTKFYPNSTLITGHDILFFWVARMLMMGRYALGKLPFPETFLHGLIYGKSYFTNSSGGGIAYIADSERKEYDLGKAVPKDVICRWEKMSKSKGNIIDPIEIIDEYGADACRMALAFSTTEAPQIDLDRRRFEEFKNFANKIWNGSRFVLMNLDDSFTSDTLAEGIDSKLLTLEDQWILNELSAAVASVTQNLGLYAFDKAAKDAYEFFWNKFCAYYVEIIKPILFGKEGSTALKRNKQKLLVTILLQALRLLHPMAPFITEELFQIMKERFKDLSLQQHLDPYTEDTIKALLSSSCTIAPFPKPSTQPTLSANADFHIVESAVYLIRNMRGEMKIPSQIATDVIIVGSGKDFELLKNESRIITALVRIVSIKFETALSEIKASTSTLSADIKVMIPLPKELLSQERDRLSKEGEKLQALLEKGQQQLANPQFIEKAPQQLVDKHKGQIESWQKELARIRSELSAT